MIFVYMLYDLFNYFEVIMSSIDPVVKAISRISKTLELIINAVEDKEDREFVISFAERKLTELKTGD